MRSVSAFCSIVLASCLFVACTENAAPTTTTTSTTVPTTSAPTSTLPPVIECPGDGDFGEGGGIASVDGVGSDASRLGRISWQQNEQCETFTLQFETSEGAPATAVPTIEISHLESYQVIRIDMDVDATAITDQLVETELVEELYVVRKLDGGMFVDFHLAGPAAARARFQTPSARLEVDLRPGFVPFTGSSAVDDNVVVVSPPRNGNVDPTTQFMGYSRTFEANVTVIATQGNEVVAETNTTAADYTETWGEFLVELGLPPGEVSVFFGEASPEDGTLDGVTLDLTVN